MGKLRRSPRLRDRATDLGLSREDVRKIVYGAGHERAVAANRLRRLVRTLRELSKTCDLQGQREWLFSEHSIEERGGSPLARLKTPDGFSHVEDYVYAMADMAVMADELFPNEPSPAYALFRALTKESRSPVSTKRL